MKAEAVFVFRTVQPQANSEQPTHHDEASDASEAVHRRGTQRVVDLELEEDHAHELEHYVGADAVDDGGPGLQHVAAGSDGDEAAQDAVADGEQVPCLRRDIGRREGKGQRGRSRVEARRWDPLYGSPLNAHPPNRTHLVAPE